MVYHICLPGAPHRNVDPEFWDRLRKALTSHMHATGLKQRELARELGIETSTLNNFLNHESKTLGGLAVALACTVLDLVCDGTKIGKVTSSGRTGLVTQPLEEQLVLEFDDSFVLRRESKHPTIVVRKPATGHDVLRLSIKKIG
jgi:transcriptional regulator with XRE-family HTH domain